jgi:hypothetical protein
MSRASLPSAASELWTTRSWRVNGYTQVWTDMSSGDHQSLPYPASPNCVSTRRSADHITSALAV